MVSVPNLTSLISAPWSIAKQTYHYYAIYALYDAAIANLLALDTLRHCTGPQNYFSIQWNGPEPTRGGGKTSMFSSDAFTQSQCAGVFFVARDQADPEMQIEGLKRNIREAKLAPEQIAMAKNVLAQNPNATHLKVGHMIGKRISIRFYAAMSGAGVAKEWDVDGSTKFWLGALGAIGGLFTPTCKFRFDPQDMGDFEDAYIEPGLALFTKKRIGWEHMGISGSLIQGWKRKENLAKRIQDKPLDPMLGAVQLFVALGLTGQLFNCKIGAFKFFDPQNRLAKYTVWLVHFTAC